MSDETDEILFNQAALKALTKVQLSALCRRYNLKPNGKERDLVERLSDYGRRLEAFKTSHTPTQLNHNNPQDRDSGPTEFLLSSSRPRLTGRRSSRSKSPSPWSVYHDLITSAPSTAAIPDQAPTSAGLSIGTSDERFGRGKGYGIPSDDVSAMADDVFGSKHESTVTGKGDESWEILDDRRASFGSPRHLGDKKDLIAPDEKGDEVELLSRSIPGSYMTDRQKAMEENEKGYGSIKSWRSADNGGFGRVAMGRGRMEEEFGGKTKPEGHRRTTSLTKRSFESLRAMTATFSLPLNLRKKDVVGPGTGNEGPRPVGLKRRRSILDPTLFGGRAREHTVKGHQRNRSSPFICHSPQSGRFRPYTPPVSRVKMEPMEEETGVPLRHSQHAGLNRQSTIRLVGESTSADKVLRSSLMGTPESLVRELRDADMRESTRSPSPPEFSKLPPLRQSTRVEEMSGIDFGLDSGMERDDDEAQEILDDREDVLDKAVTLISPTVPGAFPTTEVSQTPKKSSPVNDAPFIFGSPIHGVTDEQFSQAGLAILEELNAQLRERGVAAIGEPVKVEHIVGVGKGAGIGLGRGGGRFDHAHQREFSRMSSLNTHYAGRSRVGSQALAAPTTAGNRGPTPRSTSNGLPENSGNDRIRVTKRKASAEFTPSAPNGQPLRHAKSAATLLQTGIRPNHGTSCDAEDSPRIKRMKVDRAAATNERNGGESGFIAEKVSLAKDYGMATSATPRSRVSSGLGMMAALANGTKNTLSTVKKRLSGGPESVLAGDALAAGEFGMEQALPTDRRPASSVSSKNNRSALEGRTGAKLGTVSQTTGLPRPSSVLDSYNKKSTTAQSSYNKSSRPPPPPPGSSSARAISKPVLATAVIHHGNSIDRKTSHGSGGGHAYASSARVCGDGIDDFGRTEVLRETVNSVSTTSSMKPTGKGLITSSIIRNETRADPFSLTSSIGAKSLRLRQPGEPVIRATPSLANSTRSIGIHNKPVMKITRTPLAQSPSKARLVASKQRIYAGNGLRDAYNQGQSSISGPKVGTSSPLKLNKSGIRAPTVGGLRHRISSAELTMAAKHQDLTSRRTRMTEERKLREMLG